MTTVTVSAGAVNPTHHISLQDDTDANIALGTGNKYGFIFAPGGPRVFQEMPISPPAQQFENQQRQWVGGRGFLRYQDNNTGFFDSQRLWSTTDGKILPAFQFRFATGVRTNVDESLPGDNASMAWWKLYPNADDPTNHITRYLSIVFPASASYNADKAYLHIRRRGTPGTLTFELCSETSSHPGTVLQTVTKTTSDITDTLSVYQLFDWSGTQALTSSTNYWIKVYGASSDTSANHWEVLCNGSGTSSKYSTDNSSWTTSNVSMYYRVTDADTARKWWFFDLEGGTYMVSQNDDRTASICKTNGVRGTATAATSTTLTDSNLSMTTNQYANAYIRIYDGVGDGQVRQITSNTGTQFTVPTWDVTPDTTSRYVVYGTGIWTATTGTSGLGYVVNQPVTADKTVYFPQGQSTAIRRAYVAASTHTWAADGSNKADILFLNTDPATGLNIYSANAASATIAASATKAQGTNLTFGTSKQIGSSSYRITNLYNYNKLLTVFKEDGPYVLNGNKVDKLTSNFDDFPDTTTGYAIAVNNQYLWWSWAHSIVRTLGDNSVDMLNFRQGYDGLPADRRGTIVAAVSVGGWVFFAIDGGASNYSSIIYWNGIGWHELYRGWATGVRIRNIYYQNNLGTRGRLWIDINGEVGYIEFPYNAVNPLKDTTLNYAHEAVYTSSTFDSNDALLYKIYQSLKVLLDQGSVEVDYQTNANVGTSTWTVLGTASTSPLTDLTLQLGAVFQIRFRVRFQVTASQTPSIVSGLLTSGRMMPIPKYQWIGQFRVATVNAFTITNDIDHNANSSYSQLQTWAQQQTKLTLRSLNASADNKVVTVSLPAKSVDWVLESDWGGRISFVIMEV